MLPYGIRNATKLLSPTEGMKESSHSIRCHLLTSVPHRHVPTIVPKQYCDVNPRGYGHPSTVEGLALSKYIDKYSGGQVALSRDS